MFLEGSKAIAVKWLRPWVPESHPIPYCFCMGSLTNHGTIYSGRMYRIFLGVGESRCFWICLPLLILWSWALDSHTWGLGGAQELMVHFIWELWGLQGTKFWTGALSGSLSCISPFEGSLLGKFGVIQVVGLSWSSGLKPCLRKYHWCHLEHLLEHWALC